MFSRANSLTINTVFYGIEQIFYNESKIREFFSFAKIL